MPKHAFLDIKNYGQLLRSLGTREMTESSNVVPLPRNFEERGKDIRQPAVMNAISIDVAGICIQIDRTDLSLYLACQDGDTFSAFKLQIVYSQCYRGRQHAPKYLSTLSVTPGL